MQQLQHLIPLLCNSSLLEINIELFKRKEFRNLIGTPFEKQEQALKLLCNDEPMQLLYGGAAGGGKSFLAWTWLIFNSILYPKTSWFFARQQLKDARLFGLQTFNEVCQNFGVINASKNEIYNFNGQDNYIRFSNGSIIYLLELKHKPSDAEYQYLGSRLFTGGAIEEAGQIDFDAFETLWVRCGRYNNQKYNLAPKMLMLANPTKNFLYHNFYLPHQKGILQAPKKYIQAFVYDNPFQSETYIKSLKNLTDPIRRARLYEGNWHYHKDETTLFEFDKIQALFTNSYIEPTGSKFISVDRAGQGNDKSIIVVAHGYQIIEIVEQAKSTHDSLCELIKNIAFKHQVPMFNIIVDAGGMSDVHYSLGCKGFLGGSKAAKGIYPNLRTECAYKLAQLVKNGKLFINTPFENVKEVITQQLQAIKKSKLDADDGKLYINKKEEQKKLLGGKSPDFADALLMLMYFFQVDEEKKLFYQLTDYNSFIISKNNIKLNANSFTYVTIQVSSNNYYALSSVINPVTKNIYHTYAITENNPENFVSKILNNSNHNTSVIIYKKPSSNSVNNWNVQKRKELKRLFQQNGVSVNFSNEMNHKRCFVAHQIGLQLYAKKLIYNVNICKEAIDLINDKLNTFCTSEGLKNYTSGGYLSDCEDCLINQIFN